MIEDNFKKRTFGLIYLSIVLFSNPVSANFVVSDEIVLFGSESSGTPDIYDCKNDKYCIFLDGEIKEGDYEELKWVILHKQREYYREIHKLFIENVNYTFNNYKSFDAEKTKIMAGFKLFISSPGGDMFEAIKIANLVRELEMSAYVPMGKECKSACFMIFAGAVNRLVTSFKSIGIHSPYFNKEFFRGLSQKEADLLYLKKVEEVYKQLELFNIPKNLIEITKSTPSDQMYFLNANDMKDIYLDSVWRERILANLNGLDFDTALKMGISPAIRNEFQLNAIDEYFNYSGLIEDNTLAFTLKNNSTAHSILGTVLFDAGINPEDMELEEILSQLADKNPETFQMVYSTSLPWHKKIGNLHKVSLLLMDPPDSLIDTYGSKFPLLTLFFTDKF